MRPKKKINLHSEANNLALGIKITAARWSFETKSANQPCCKIADKSKKPLCLCMFCNSSPLKCSPVYILSTKHHSGGNNPLKPPRAKPIHKFSLHCALKLQFCSFKFWIYHMRRYDESLLKRRTCKPHK